MSCNHRNGTECPECDIGPFTRNHYFTGKLLVEKDFKDEQAYYIDKLRHHHRQLHGWGVVCGMKVKQHNQAACQDHIVCIEPGTAIDCCGHEIILPEEECIDLRAFEEFRTLYERAQKERLDPRNLQLCIKYRECPSEHIPVLYDECGCDETQCAPNRILESYDFELKVDPDLAPPKDLVGARLEWLFTDKLARAHRVAYDANKGRIYELSSTDPATLLALDASNHSILASAQIDGEVMDLAVSADGGHVYVSVRKPTGVILRVAVFDSDLNDENELTLEGANGSDVFLASSPGGRLYALNTNNQKVYAWDNPSTDTAAERKDVAVGSDPRGIKVLPNGNWVLVSEANAGNEGFTLIKKSDLTTKTLSFPGTKSTRIAVADTSNGVRVYAIDESSRVSVYGFNAAAAQQLTPLGNATLQEQPVDLVASGGGRWAYVLTVDAGGVGSVTVVDTHRIEANLPGAVGSSITVGHDPRDLAAGPGRLYAAYNGQPADPNAGGVAVVEVIETPCERIFENTLEECPDCEEPDCLVLAVIKDWVPGNAITDGQIDNLTYRKLLPSTSVIAEAVLCLLNQKGGDGDPGEQGPPGLGIDDVEAVFVDCAQPGSAQIQMVGSTRKLVLEIPKGCDGQDGENGTNGEDGLGIDDVQIEMVDCETPGSATIEMIGGLRTLVLKIPSGCKEKEFTHICAISWKHNGQLPIDDFAKGRGLVIAFDRPVINQDLHRQSIRVLGATERDEIMCWCELRPEIICGLKLDRPCEIPEDVPECIHDPNAEVNAVRFLPSGIEKRRYQQIRVIVQGDFIREIGPDGRPGKAIDADHLPPWLPHARSGDDVEGGTFESWFELVYSDADLNLSHEEEFNGIPGMGHATVTRLMEERAIRPFTSLEDFRERVAPNAPNWERMRPHITVFTEEN